MEQTGDTTRFWIDLSWYEEQNRSFTAVAGARLCQQCRDKETPSSHGALLKEIKKCNESHGDLLNPNLPLLELVFRLFLTGSNEPLTLSQIREKLQGNSLLTSLKDISLPRLKLIVENDSQYGLRPVALSTSP